MPMDLVGALATRRLVGYHARVMQRHDAHRSRPGTASMAVRAPMPAQTGHGCCRRRPRRPETATGG